MIKLKSNLVSQIKECLQQYPVAKDLLGKIFKIKAICIWEENAFFLPKEIDYLYLNRETYKRKWLTSVVTLSRLVFTIERTTELVPAL